MVYNIMVKFRGVAQLVARDIWDVEAAGSNPVTPTRFSIKDRLFGRSFMLNGIIPTSSVGATDVLLRKTGENDAGACCTVGWISAFCNFCMTAFRRSVA